MMMNILKALAIVLLSASAAFGQSAPKSYLSATGTNSTLIQAGQSVVRYILPINTTATVYFLKVYDKATPPTCGTDTPKLRLPVPAATTGNGFMMPVDFGIIFPNGLGFCLTGGIADNDTTPAAAGVAINFGVTTY